MFQLCRVFSMDYATFRRQKYGWLTLMWMEYEFSKEQDFYEKVLLSGSLR